MNRIKRTLESQRLAPVISLDAARRGTGQVEAGRVEVETPLGSRVYSKRVALSLAVAILRQVGEKVSEDATPEERLALDSGVEEARTALLHLTRALRPDAVCVEAPAFVSLSTAVDFAVAILRDVEESATPEDHADIEPALRAGHATWERLGRTVTTEAEAEQAEAAARLHPFLRAFA